MIVTALISVGVILNAASTRTILVKISLFMMENVPITTTARVQKEMELTALATVSHIVNLMHAVVKIYR